MLKSESSGAVTWKYLQHENRKRGVAYKLDVTSFSFVILLRSMDSISILTILTILTLLTLCLIGYILYVGGVV